MLAGPAFASTGVVVANSGGKTTPQFRQWQEFRNNVDQKSNNTLLLDYLIFGELGNSQSMLDAIVGGRASLGSISCAGITRAIPEFAVTQMPFLFANDEEADFVFDKYLTSIFSEIASQHGLVLLHWTDGGWSNLYARAQVVRPVQLRDQQVRTLDNPVSIDFIQALKAKPTIIGLGEAAVSSQADKIFAGMATLQGFTLYPQPNFSFLTLTKHSYNCGVIVANKAWWDSVTPQEQTIIRTSFTSTAEIRKQLREQTKLLEAKLMSSGTTINELTVEQHNAWAAVGLPLYPQILAEAGGRSIEVDDAIRAGKQAFLREGPQSDKK